MSSTGKIKYTKAVNDFGLVIKSCQSKLTMKRYEKHSKRQGARANHPKQTALPECHAPRADYPTRAPKADCPIRAPSAERPFFQSKQFLGGFIPTRPLPHFRGWSDSDPQSYRFRLFPQRRGSEKYEGGGGVTLIAWYIYFWQLYFFLQLHIFVDPIFLTTSKLNFGKIFNFLH